MTPPLRLQSAPMVVVASTRKIAVALRGERHVRSTHVNTATSVAAVHAHMRTATNVLLTTVASQ
jgi:hypothetical protein